MEAGASGGRVKPGHGEWGRTPRALPNSLLLHPLGRDLRLAAEEALEIIDAHRGQKITDGLLSGNAYIACLYQQHKSRQWRKAGEECQFAVHT
jgi:hypothetical protein